MNRTHIIVIVVSLCASTTWSQGYNINGPSGMSTVVVTKQPNGIMWSAVGAHGGYGSIIGPVGTTASLAVGPQGGVVPVIMPSAPQTQPAQDPIIFPPIEYPAPAPIVYELPAPSAPAPASEPMVTLWDDKTPTAPNYIMPKTTPAFGTWLKLRFGLDHPPKLSEADTLKLYERYVLSLEACIRKLGAELDAKSVTQTQSKPDFRIR